MENKTRKQLSPESLEKLALAREKALQTRLKNKAIREQLLEPDKELEPETEPETETKPEQIPIPDKIEPKKIQPDTDEDEEVAKPKKVKKKPNRSKIIISNDSSSSDDDDTPVVYIRTKKKTKQKPKPTVVEHEEVVQDLQPQYQPPPEIVRQVPLEQVYERPVIQRPSWW